jgi:protein ImuB
MFASIHVPDFSVEAIVRHQPELRNKPVAIVDGKPPILIVAGLNTRARDAGIDIGMTKFQAEQLPNTAIRQRSLNQETSAQAALLDCASAFSPRVEDTCPGTVVLDIEGLDRLFGSDTELAENLLREVLKAGLMAHIALASNPDAATCAARGPSRVTVIKKGAEGKYLRNFPIGILPLDTEAYETLQCWGIRCFGDLARLPVKGLAERLGQNGVHLHRLACGRASRPLRPRQESPRFEESMDLDYSIESLEPLTFILNRLCDALFHRLRRRGMAARELDLTLHRDHAGDPFVLPLRLPIPVQNPRIVTKLFMLALETHSPGAAVYGVRIEAQPTKPRIVQNGLFTPLSPEPEQLELTLARIAGIVGGENVGSPELEDSHARNRFRLKHFGSVGSQNPHPALRADLSRRERDARALRAERSEGVPLPPGEVGPKGRVRVCSFRVFRPALEATVQTRDGIPTWIGFHGLHGTIQTASGPWRGSGDWWKTQHWDREEWDAAVGELLVRIYRDVRNGRWYAEGIYD